MVHTPAAHSGITAPQCPAVIRLHQPTGVASVSALLGSERPRRVMVLDGSPAWVRELQLELPWASVVAATPDQTWSADLVVLAPRPRPTGVRAWVRRMTGWA
ncbi:MAG: hypothetical protein ACI8PZ_001809 [Myxococcota bacterium]|jgi:hypothetical protein